MISFLTEPFEHDFMQRAAIACVLIGFTNGFLGSYIVLRRLSLMANALAHSMLPGVALGAILFGLAPLALFFGGVFAAIAVAVGGLFLARGSRLSDDTTIAALFTISFALGALLISFSPTRIDLMHFLFGDILGITSTDLWIVYSISFIAVGSLVALQRGMVITLIEPNVARSQGVPVSLLHYWLLVLIVLAIIASLQAVGIVLSLGLLVLPAATAYLLTNSFDRMLWGGGVIGAVGCLVGLVISYHAEVGSGSAIVLTLGVAFGVAFFWRALRGE